MPTAKPQTIDKEVDRQLAVNVYERAIGRTKTKISTLFRCPLMLYHFESQHFA